MKNKNNFANHVRETILPRLERMKVLEEQHLNNLRSVTHMDVSEFILRSETSLQRINISITEYNDFLLSKV